MIENEISSSKSDCKLIRLALIHHNDQERLREVRKVAHEFQAQRRIVSCNGNIGICSLHRDEIIEVYDQIDRKEVPAKGLYFLQGMLSIFLQRWVYISKLNKSWLKKTLFYIFQMFPLNQYHPQAIQSRLIECILIDKHIMIWTGLANSEDRGCIVFEDDCRFRGEGDSSQLYLRILELSKEFDYIDLAGGYSFEELGLGEEEFFISEGSILANTTCAYYISKDLARLAIRKIQINSYLRYLGVGFFLNGLTSSGHLNIRSIMFRKPLLLHGSFDGGVISSITQKY